MKTLLFAIAITFASFAAADDYYGYQRQYNPPSSSQMAARQQSQQNTYMRNQINRDMNELELRSSMRRMDMINGESVRGHNRSYDRH